MRTYITVVFEDPLLEKLEHYAGEPVKEEADEILEKSQAAVPVDSGRLKQSGRVEKESETRYRVVYGGHVRGKNVDYAAAVEAQTGFLKSSVQGVAKTLPAKLAQEVKRVLRRIRA